MSTKTRKQKRAGAEQVNPVAQLHTELKRQVVPATGEASGLPSPQVAQKGVEDRQAKAIRGCCCQKIIDGTVAVGGLYLQLCEYIRKNNVAPKLVSAEMGTMGFSKVVISKVNKVAQAPDDVWNAFAARTIGFNKALDMTRNPVIAALAESTGQDVVDIKAQVQELTDEEQKPESGLVPPTAEEQAERFMRLLEQGASKVLSAAAAMELKRAKTIRGGNGYLLVVKRDLAWKPVQPKTETGDTSEKE